MKNARTLGERNHCRSVSTRGSSNLGACAACPKLSSHDQPLTNRDLLARKVNGLPKQLTISISLLSKKTPYSNR